MTRAALLLVSIVLVTGCGAKQKMASAPMAAAAATSMGPPTPPPPLDRSLFARDPHGQLSEDALQKILGTPIELDLPSRVGVLPVITALTWRGPTPDYERVPAGVAPLVARLRKDAAFSLVTEMMPIPSGSLGMEALREASARYRLRYVILYREVLAKKHHQNALTWFYATGLGALFVPGKHHEVYGYIEATMFDVKTGLLMFTTRRAIMASKSSNEWRTNDKLDKLASNAVTKFAPDLGQDFLLDVRRFADAAIAENEKRFGAKTYSEVGPSGPAIVQVPPTTPVMAAPQ
ncbi:MAG TPA: hypothetical protein VIV11_13630 [Kofleriaceae bacterium]